ncbi:MAG: hypothetical protein NC205_09820 [Prevotella sp.]|nr:hypothetical protein [Alistipes senegalensis]MCM1358883.1 hypothetical protein [Prevotella sp.]
MKKTFKKVTVSLTAMLMLFGSTYTTLGSVSATNGEIQPRGTWAMYGDVNNDGTIDVADLVAISSAVDTFEYLTGDSRLPLRYAVAKPEVYYLTIPQAADLDGDNYITDNDVKCVQCYLAKIDNEAGRCGQPFFINE